MKTEDAIMIKHLLEDEGYRSINFSPIEYFSITSGIFNLLESLESAEINFRLGIIEAEIILFCTLNIDNVLLKPYVCELREFLLTDFSLEKMQKCKVLFENMRELYMEKYAKTIMLMEVR
ncbi:hypothetical protein [Bacteroides oleiciplenus]|uniref:hypothetical protein n=1 Tax=Bacteroides oleiciplenus TaxID=626931 RepID=UPI0026DD1B84|nr:hypothetical protein [Bacteroides oleiciplenus]